MKNIKDILLTTLFCCLNGLACSFTLKSNLGVGAFDAFSNTIALITNIKIGYVLIFTCGLIFIINLIIIKKDFKVKMCLQMLLPTITGIVVNFFYYDVLKFEISNIYLRYIDFILSNSFSAVCVAFLLKIDLTVYPLEALCQTLDVKTKKDFKFYRTSADVVLILISVILTFIYKIPLQVGIGTIISMCIFGQITSRTLDILNKIGNH